MLFDLNAISPTLAKIAESMRKGQSGKGYIKPNREWGISHDAIEAILSELRESWERRDGECVWTLKDDHGWPMTKTSCGRDIKAEMLENSLYEPIFCPYCGKKIQEVNNEL